MSSRQGQHPQDHGALQTAPRDAVSAPIVARACNLAPYISRFREMKPVREDVPRVGDRGDRFGAQPAVSDT